MLVVVGVFIRLRIQETPEFREVLRENKVARFPVVDTILHHPKDLIIGLGAKITEISWIYVITIFGLNYAVTTLGLSRSLVLGAIALGAAGELITIPLFGHLSDLMGRRPFIFSAVLPRSCCRFPSSGVSRRATPRSWS